MSKQLYVIGYNGNGQLPLNNKNISQLIRWKQSKQQQISLNQVKCSLNTINFSNNKDDFWIATNKRCIKKTYFEKNNIKIIKLCANISGQSTFYISEENRVYELNKIMPCLYGVIDIKSGTNHGMALCKSFVLFISIITYWTRDCNGYTPDDINNLILLFYGIKSHQVYKLNYNSNMNAYEICHKIEEFDDKLITKIECGSHHSLLLQSNGTVWCYGKNDDTPIAIKYFMDNNIKIIDIKCGLKHNLAMNDKGNIYSWGRNIEGQCGNGTFKNIDEPQLIESFKDLKIINIKCGAFHSYVMTDDGQHFLFGSNLYNECITMDGIGDDINIPFCVNQIIEESCNNKQIINDIFLGYQNTIILTMPLQISQKFSILQPRLSLF